MNSRGYQTPDRGSVLVLSAFLIVSLIAMTALAVDLGYAVVTRCEVQNAADAGALAGAGFIFDRELLMGAPDGSEEDANAQTDANVFTRANAVNFSGLDDNLGTASTSQGVAVTINSRYTVSTNDVATGYLAYPGDPDESLQFNTSVAPRPFSPPVLFYVPPNSGNLSSAVPQSVGKLPMPKRSPPAVSNIPDVVGAASGILAPPAVNLNYNMNNSVKFKVRRTTASPNGPVDMFFSKVMPGNTGQIDIETSATATWEDNIKGFRIRTDSSGNIVGPNVSKLLPFALDVNTFGAMAAGLSGVDLYKYDPKGGPVTKPVYPGTPPDYRNRVTMSNGYLDWLLGDTAGIPYDNLSVSSIRNWDKLDPLNVYNRSYDFIYGALKSSGSNPPKKIWPRPDLSSGLLFPPSDFNPYDPTVYSSLMPGDQIKESFLVPLTLQRREYPDDLSDLLAWTPSLSPTFVLNLISRLTGIQSTDTVWKSDVHIGNFGCLFLGTSAPQGIRDYYNKTPTDLAEFKRQVEYGLNQNDFNQMGGRFQLNASGYITVRGTTQVPSVLKSSLLSIRGQPRIIALYEPQTPELLPSGSLTGNAMEADYKIVGFAGIIVLEVIDIPEPRSIDRAGNAYDQVFQFLNSQNWLRTMPVVGPLITNLLNSENQVLSRANSIKVLIQPEFVVDATAIGGGSKLNIPAGRKTSAFVYRPLVITR